MNKEKREQKKRAQRLEQRQRHLAKQLEIDEEMLNEEEPIEEVPLSDSGEEEPEAIEVQEKEMGESMEMEYMRPTSFAELDERKQAEERAHEVRELSWNVTDLVYNILGHPMMKPAEKAKAIAAVGSDFEKRLSQKTGDDMKKDLDVLAAEALLAQDKRHLTLFERLQGMVKGDLSASASAKLSDEDFALVIEADGDKVRKYPIHDAANVRKSLANAVKANNEEAKSVLPKIRAAAKKFGIETTMEKDHNAIVIEKDANGDWRWVGWTTNKFIDLDGDILAENAHKEYTDWLDKNQHLSPILLNWHTPGTACQSPADFAAYENGFLILSGKLTEDEAALILKAQTLTDLGMSHGTLVLERDTKDPRVITKYRMYEASFLPLENAANPWTDFETLIKEVDMDKQKYFASLVGEERAKAFLEQTAKAQKALEDAGVESKEKKEPEVPAAPETHVKEPEAAAPAALDVKALVEEVVKQTGLQELSTAFAKLQEDHEKVGALEDLVKSLQTSKEEDLANMISAPAARFAWMQEKRASASSENLYKESDENDKKLKDAVPGVSDDMWLSKATGTTPIPAQ